MNLAARGISYHLGDSNASSFTSDKHPNLRANYIMANPPFNKKDWRTEEQLTKDIRWRGYATPPVSNANYAWILHMLYHLDQTSGVAGFLLSNGALEDEDTLAIREQLIRNDKVEAIFILPREMFYSTDTSVTLWILNQNKKGGIWHGRKLSNRQGRVLFVDLRRWDQNNSTIKTDKSKKTFVVFNEEQIQQICEIYHGWQTTNDYESYDKAELYHSATTEEIEMNGWSLVPSKFIKFEDKSPLIEKSTIENNTRQIVSGLLSQGSIFNTSLKGISSQLDILKSISNSPLEEIGNCIEPIDERNTANKKIEVCGINKTKSFMPTVADMTGVDISKYKIVKKGQFAFSGMQTGRDECIRIALYEGDDPILISPAYTTFKLITDKVLPEYLLLFFKRSEMDRYGWFISDSSVRANLDWPRFLAIKFPLPDIDIQRAIVNIYNCAEEAKRIAEEADRLSKEICPALMQHLIHNSDSQ
jgi:type I restriction-modification system DNA methylase subunit